MSLHDENIQEYSKEEHWERFTHICNTPEHENQKNTQIHDNSFTAVSYTHLDVYKRQVVYCLIKLDSFQRSN